MQFTNTKKVIQLIYFLSPFLLLLLDPGSVIEKPEPEIRDIQYTAPTSRTRNTEKKDNLHRGEAGNKLQYTLHDGDVGQGEQLLPARPCVTLNTCSEHSCGIVILFYGSGSEFWQVTVRVLVPTFDKYRTFWVSVSGSGSVFRP